MMSTVTSGWNWSPRLRPATNAWGPASDSARRVAPDGSVNESKCHWNHGPSGTSSGSRLRTWSQPISEVARNPSRPSTRASSWPPKHRPRIGISASIARSITRTSRGMNPRESSKAANSDPSDTTRSYLPGSTSRSWRSILTTSPPPARSPSQAVTWPGGVGSSCWRISARRRRLSGSVIARPPPSSLDRLRRGRRHRMRGQLRSHLRGDVVHGIGEAGHHLRQLVVGGRERGREQRLVPRVAVACRLRGERDETSLERCLIDASGHAELRGEERLLIAWVDERHAQQVAVPAHLLHHRDAIKRPGELVPQARPAVANPLDQPLRAQDVQDGQPDSAGQRRAVPGVP